MADIEHHNIRIFQAPIYENEDEETLGEHEAIISKIPFAVVGSNSEIETEDGRVVRGRSYPWGVVEVDNEEHCDFVKLRQMLIRTHMEELREHTTGELYENYRSEKLLGMGVTQDHSVFKEIKYVQCCLALMIHLTELVNVALQPSPLRRGRFMTPSSPRWRPR